MGKWQAQLNSHALHELHYARHLRFFQYYRSRLAVVGFLAIALFSKTVYILGA